MQDDHEPARSISSEESRFSEDFRSDAEDDAPLQDDDNPVQQADGQQGEHIRGEEGQKASEQIAQVKNPVSAYMMFVKGWKESHPDEKMSISLMGDIWKELSEAEKSVHEAKYREEKAKYQAYIAAMMAQDPNFKKGQGGSKKFFFPLHRIRAIMKLDSDYTCSNENTQAMAQLAEYFGEYFLEEVKKNTEGKKRIDLGDFLETINSNQSHMWFLNCLVDEHNAEDSHKKERKRQRDRPEGRAPNSANKQAEEGRIQAEEGRRQTEEGGKKPEKEGNGKKKEGSAGRKKVSNIGKGQRLLTDMF